MRGGERRTRMPGPSSQSSDQPAAFRSRSGLTEPEDAAKLLVLPAFGPGQFQANRSHFGTTMYAIIRIGGHQYRAEPGKTIRIQSMEADLGSTVKFEDVLLGADGDTIKVGAPGLSGASVSAEVLRHGRGEKIIIFKHKRRKNYRRKQGHRQGFTEVRVNDINLG